MSPHPERETAGRQAFQRRARLRTHAVWVAGLGLCVACQTKGPDVAPPEPAQAAPAGSVSAARKVDDAAPANGMSLVPGRPRSFRSSGVLLDLEDGVRLSRVEFDGRRLSARSPQAVQATERGDLILALDEQSPRPLLGPSVLLRSVVDEDRELSPGWHRLVAFVQSTDELELQLTTFQLELDLPKPSGDSHCLLFGPPGTVYAPLGGSVELSAAPLAPDVKRLEYYVAGEPAAVLRVPGLESARVSGFLSGDHRLGVRCYGEANALLGQSERIVTINAEPKPGSP